VTFSKTGPLIFIGNLDLLTIWERAARRASLALQYSKGFHPQPKIQFAAPLPLGFSSRCEIVDLWLSEDVECAELPRRLQPVVPAGISILGVESVDSQAPPLSTQVKAAEYEITFSAPLRAEDLAARVGTLLAVSSMPRERRGRHYDLRPLIQSLEVVGSSSVRGPVVHMRLTALEGATGRPDEVLDALGLPREDARIERVALIIAS
jgi:radical SAM-linked protein